MTDRDVVERVGGMWARGVVGIRPRKAHHRRAFATAIRGQPAAEFMHFARPMLSISRQQQIDAALARTPLRARRWTAPRTSCAVEGCERPVTRRGLCKPHYHSWWKAKKSGRPANHLPVDAPAQWPELAPDECTDVCEQMWLAGLLEGEGNFAVARVGPHVYPLIRVEMCDEDVVARVRSLFCASTFYEDVPKNPVWSPTFVTQVSGLAAAEWMRRLRPLMGSRRGAAIDAALADYRPIRLVDPPESCVIPGCAEPHRSRGLCHKHYMSWLRDVAKGRTPRVTPLR